MSNSYCVSTREYPILCEYSRAYRSYGTSERPHLNGNSIYRWNDKCAAASRA